MKIKKYRLKGEKRYDFVRDGIIVHIEPGEIVVRGSDGIYYFKGQIDIPEKDLEKYFERELSDDEKSELRELRKGIISAATQGRLANSSLTDDVKAHITNTKHCYSFNDLADVITTSAFHLANIVCKRYIDED